MMSLMSDSPPLGPCLRALPRYFTSYIQLPQAIKSIDVYFGKHSITILYLTVLIYLICLRSQLEYLIITTVRFYLFNFHILPDDGLTIS
jgi:hypothetical protein